MPTRIAASDADLWTKDPAGQTEVRKRLGWLKAPQVSRGLMAELPAFLQSLQSGRFHPCPIIRDGRVFAGPRSTGPDLWCSRTDRPNRAWTWRFSIQPTRCRYAPLPAGPRWKIRCILSPANLAQPVKSMLTLIIFWARARRRVGQQADRHFIAITDPGTALDRLAQERNFRHIFRADPNVGGRYSALTAFGVVPAALIGLDTGMLLDRSQWMADQCLPDVPAARNPGLGAGCDHG